MNKLLSLLAVFCLAATLAFGQAADRPASASDQDANAPAATRTDDTRRNDHNWCGVPGGTKATQDCGATKTVVCTPQNLLLAVLRSGERARKIGLVTVGIVQMDVPLAPRGVPWGFRSQSFLFEISPESIHITHVEDQSSPAIYSMALFQVEDREVRSRSAQRGESCTWSTVQEFHSKHISIEPYGGFHARDLQSDRRDFFNHHWHRSAV
jgi:hypothetical protein